MSKTKLPARGEDAQYDAVLDAIEKVSMADPHAVKGCLIAVLRFLRDRVGLPGIIMTFDEAVKAGTDPQDVSAIVFALDPDARTLVMHLVDAPNKLAALGRMQALSPNVEDVRVIQGGKGGKVS